MEIGSWHSRIDFSACLIASNNVIEACGFSRIPSGLAMLQIHDALVLFLFLNI